MDEELRDSYRILKKRLFHKGRIVTPSFISENNMLPFFQAIGFEPFPTLNEPICPRFVVEFYHSLEVKRNELDIPYIEFKLGQFTFTLTSSCLSQILKTPHALETFYTSEWSLNSLDNHPNSNYFGPKHDIVKKVMDIVIVGEKNDVLVVFVDICNPRIHHMVDPSVALVDPWLIQARI
ncbi:hypothetical protein Tco_1542238 [Tanacetum coccineum]